MCYYYYYCCCCFYFCFVFFCCCCYYFHFYVHFCYYFLFICYFYCTPFYFCLDYILSVVVVDDSLANHADITSPMPAGLSVNIFRPSLNELPRIENLGDIVMFRRFKVGRVSE